MMQEALLDSLEKKVEYNPEKSILWVADDIYFSEKCETGDIGCCVQCGNYLETLSFHKLAAFNAIVTKCAFCDRFLLFLYDLDWNWCKEIDLIVSKRQPSAKIGFDDFSSLSGLQLLERIPENALRTIFSPREIEAMFLRAEGGKYVRQYLYNARKKYSKFSDVFGISIDV